MEIEDGCGRQHESAARVRPSSKWKSWMQSPKTLLSFKPEGRGAADGQWTVIRYTVRGNLHTNVTVDHRSVLGGVAVGGT